MTPATAIARKVFGAICRTPDVRAVELAVRLELPMPEVRAALRTLKNAGRIKARGNTVARSYRRA